MTTLPQELLLGVVEQLDDNKTLKNISLANSVFRNHAQKKLLKEIKLYTNLDDSKQKLRGLKADNCRLGKNLYKLSIAIQAVLAVNQYHNFTIEDMEYQAKELMTYLVALFIGLKTESRRSLELSIDVEADTDPDFFFQRYHQYARSFLRSIFSCFGAVDTSSFLHSLSLCHFQERDTDLFRGEPRVLGLGIDNGECPGFDSDIFRENMDALRMVTITSGSIVYSDVDDDYKLETSINDIVHSALSYSGVTMLKIGVDVVVIGLSLPLLHDAAGQLTSLTIEDTCINASVGSAITSCVGLRELTLECVTMDWEEEDGDFGLEPWEVFFTSLTGLPLAKLCMHRLDSKSCDSSYCHAGRQCPMLILEREEDFISMKILIEGILSTGGKVMRRVAWERFSPITCFDDIPTCRHGTTTLRRVQCPARQPEEEKR